MFRLHGESDSIIYHRTDPTTTVPLFLHKNSLRIRARPLIHHVRRFVTDDILVKLSSRSPTNFLDRRLDDLALPKHGTKLDNWSRIQQRENELFRGRKAQAAHDAERMVGLDGWRMEFAIPMAELVSRRKLNVNFTSSPIIPPRQWCDQCVKGRGVEIPHKRAALERAGESTLAVFAFEFCFFKTFGSVSEWWQKKERRVLYWSIWTLDTWRRFPQQRRRSLIT